MKDLFFQVQKYWALDKNNLNIISVDDILENMGLMKWEKSIREWQIDLVNFLEKHKYNLNIKPMFDPSSNWLCLNTETQLIGTKRMICTKVGL